MKNDEQDKYQKALEDIKSLLKGFKPKNIYAMKQSHVLLSLLPCTELEIANKNQTELDIKYLQLKGFFNNKIFETPQFSFEKFWIFSLFYKKPDLKQFLDNGTNEAIEKYKNQHYFTLATISKESIVEIFPLPIEITALIVSNLGDPRLHIWATEETENISVVGNIENIDIT